MERRGIDAAAADRRRDHEPPAHRGEDRAALRAARSCTCSTPRARSGVVSALLDADSARALDAENRERAGAPARRCTRAGASSPLLSLDAARANRPTLDFGAPRTSPRPRSSGAASRRRRRSTSSCRYIDWTFFFTAWELEGKFPAILDHPSTAPRRASSTTTAQTLLDAHRRREAAHARAACTASGRPRATATTSCSSATRRARTRSLRFPMLRQQRGTDRRQAAPLPRRLRRAGRTRRLRSRRRVRGHRGPRRRRARAALREGARRLQRDHGEGARRPPRRGVRRVPARSARAASGATAPTSSSRTRT